MLTLRVSTAPVTIAGAHFSGIEKWSRRIVLLTLLASVRKRWRFEPATGSVPRPVAQGGGIHACQACADFRSHHGLSDRSERGRGAGAGAGTLAATGARLVDRAGGPGTPNSKSDIHRRGARRHDLPRPGLDREDRLGRPQKRFGPGHQGRQKLRLRRRAGHCQRPGMDRRRARCRSSARTLIVPRHRPRRPGRRADRAGHRPGPDGPCHPRNQRPHRCWHSSGH